MVVPHFLESAEAFGLLVHKASFNHRLWPRVTAAIEDRFADATCDIAFLPAHGCLPAFRFNGQGEGIWRPVNPVTDASELRSGSSESLLGSGTHSSDEARASVCLMEDRTGVWQLRLRARTDTKAAVERSMQEWLGSFAQLLSRCFCLSVRLQERGDVRTSDFETLWDPLPFGTLVLQPGLRVRFANSAAEDWLGTRTLFRPFGRDKRLRPVASETADLLEQVSSQLFSGERERAMIEFKGHGSTILSATLLAVRPGMLTWPTRASLVQDTRRVLVSLSADSPVSGDRPDEADGEIVSLSPRSTVASVRPLDA